MKVDLVKGQDIQSNEEEKKQQPEKAIRDALPDTTNQTKHIICVETLDINSKDALCTITTKGTTHWWRGILKNTCEINKLYKVMLMNAVKDRMNWLRLN